MEVVEFQGPAEELFSRVSLVVLPARYCFFFPCELWYVELENLDEDGSIWFELFCLEVDFFGPEMYIRLQWNTHFYDLESAFF